MSPYQSQLSALTLLQSPDGRSCSSARLQGTSAKHGSKLAAELLTLGLVLEAKPHLSEETNRPIRWQVSYRDLPCITPAPFATLDAVEAWWREWATNAIAEGAFLRDFEQLCDTADKDIVHALSEWLIDTKMGQMPPQLRSLFGRLDQAQLTRPRDWRKQGAALFLARKEQPPQTLKMKMSHALYDAGITGARPAL